MSSQLASSRSTLLLLGGLAGLALLGNVVLTRKLVARDPDKESAPPRMMAFGDSVTQYGFDAERMGWLAQLQHWYQRRLDVFARGFGGYNSRWAVVMMGRLFRPGAHDTKLVTIFLGINDAVLPGQRQHVPLPEYRSNMRAIVKHVRTVYPNAAIVLIAPAPVHLGKWGAHRAAQGSKLDRSQEHTAQYAKALLEVAKEMGVPAVDLHTALGSGDQVLADKYLHDGLHLSSEGNAILFKELQRTILAHYPYLNPESMRMQAPWHGHVDPEHPADSILKAL